eukprot:9737641-Alexandrium_andersonii.AAC.1
MPVAARREGGECAGEPALGREEHCVPLTCARRPLQRNARAGPQRGNRGVWAPTGQAQGSAKPSVYCLPNEFVPEIRAAPPYGRKIQHGGAARTVTFRCGHDA